ncbi:hypothetical protein [Halorubrum sp. Atlit-26R]|uniref:hypothetical protein n=1 Tax=Halorubrum sp. Atlit-26R TaxID=2282128 RepID=UPI000EF1FD6F|nr:hypothetical protein [Halorubrum sp. Atlit-26R]RLM72886.1 hypothetical protein DVK07_05120 [Halorubrum sp. Atlit-26R]
MRGSRADGVDRDDDDPFRPNTTDDREKPRAMRSLPAASLSRWLLPQRVHRRAVSVTVETAADAYDRDEPVPVAITVRNPLPVPVTVRTRAPVPWTWHVDGHRDASHVPEPLPETDGQLVLDRGERRRFHRTWSGQFKTDDRTWAPAERGEHTIGAGLTVADPEAAGVYDETTVRIR